MSTINEIFKPLYTSDKRYYLLTGGRSSLKSTTTHDFIARLTYERGHGILFTRWTMTSAEKSIIPEFRLTCQRLGIEHHFKFTKDRVTNIYTQSFVLFSGIKTSSGYQTARLKSIAGITTWVVDEGEDFIDEKTFDTIDDSIRTNTHQNRVIWIMNPTTPEHFIYKRFIEPKNKKVKMYGYDVTVSDLPEVEHIHSTYHIALQYLSDDWVAKADRFKAVADASDDPYKSHYYWNYIGGWLEKAEGVVFPNWSEGTFDTSLAHIWGMDFGYTEDPTTHIKIAIDEKRKKLYLKEYLYQKGMKTSHIAGHLEETLDDPDELTVADSAEPRLIDELNDEGFNVVGAAKGPDSIRIGIQRMNEYEIIVDPDSDNLKRELNNYIYHDKKSNTPIDAYNHLIDPARYGVMELTEPQTFYFK